MPEAIATPEELEPAPARSGLGFDRLNDFSDRLSPMLVKELRQGLRAKTFVIVFLTLQALLGLVLLTSIGVAAQPQNAGASISGVIFMFFSIAVLVIQPIRGIGALHREIEGKSIELLVLTHLSAWKIVLGKWVSIVAQSALLLAAVLPYLILRYWFGDMNLFGEITLLILVFILSATMTAVIIGVSSKSSMIIRGLLPLLVAACLLMIIPGLCFGREFDSLVTSTSMQTPQSFWAVVIAVMSSLYISWTALGQAASTIAPAAENHTTPRRLVTLGITLLLVAVTLVTQPQIEFLIGLAIIIGIPAIITALTEPIALLPPICQPFVKRGTLGILAGRVLYPGWPSGVLFSAVLVGILITLLRFGGSTQPDDKVTIILTALLSSLLMPAALMCFFEKKIRGRFTIYLLLQSAQLISTLVLFFIAAEAPSDGRGFLLFFSWIPAISFPLLSFDQAFQLNTIWLISLGTALTYGLILLINAVLRFSHAREVENECRDYQAPNA